MSERGIPLNSPFASKRSLKTARKAAGKLAQVAPTDKHQTQAPNLFVMHENVAVSAEVHVCLQ